MLAHFPHTELNCLGCRGLADLGAKDRYAGLPAACVAGLQCAPFVVSSAWAASPEQMAEELAAYSINLESSVRKASDLECPKSA